MKKILSVTFFLFAGFGITGVHSQLVPTYTIPSYDITVNGYADFRENFNDLRPNQTEGKRDVDVQVKSGTRSPDCQATVWVYTLDRNTVLGPYTLSCEDILQVEIDDNEWGVLVLSGADVNISVWIGSSDSFKPQRVKLR
jgi:hypothetical protein